MPKKAAIYWPKLIPGILLKRYKRFLADVKLQDGTIVTAHCANSGRMTTCMEPGCKVYISYHDNPKRKLKYTWQISEMSTSLVGVNTNIPNKLVANATKNGDIKECLGYDEVISEVKTSDHTRLDLLLKNKKGKKCYIEVKNCTLVSDRHAYFPDAVTTRGQKHLYELLNLMDNNTRCIIFYLVQRMDADVFSPADDIDPEYGKILRKVVKNGVEILVYDVLIDLSKISLNKNVEYKL